MRAAQSVPHLRPVTSSRDGRVPLTIQTASLAHYSAPAFLKLRSNGGSFKALSEDDMIEVNAEALVGQQAVGWFQDRMELARARSVRARSWPSPNMQKTQSESEVSRKLPTIRAVGFT